LFGFALAGQKGRGGMKGRTGDELLRLRVRTGGLSLGRSADLVLDLAGRRVLGLDVHCGDGVMRFLPLAGASLGDDAIAVDSALVLLDEPERRFYAERGTALSAARGLAVVRDGRALGALRDVVLGRDQRIAAVLVEGVAQPVGLDDSIGFADGRRRAPAA
jgi:hypothetical protein